MFFTITLLIHFKQQAKLLLIEVIYIGSLFLLHSQSSNQIEPTGKTNGNCFTHVL